VSRHLILTIPGKRHQIAPRLHSSFYDDDKGQQVTSTNQLPEDNSDFYHLYYCNHRVLQHGNLTRMISFQWGIPWVILEAIW
jgi:hypothetical protein